MKTYSEMILHDDFGSRLEYLKLLDNNTTSPRHMSMQFYKSKTWNMIRKQIIDRDLAFDMGVFGVYIDGPVFVHHINPINESDIVHQTKRLTDPENLITVSLDTHNAIHYKQEVKDEWVERTPGDTILW